MKTYLKESANARFNFNFKNLITNRYTHSIYLLNIFRQLFMFMILFGVMSQGKVLAQVPYCVDNHTLSGAVTNTSQQQGFRAMNTISSTHDIEPGTNVIYEAGTSITLTPGFIAKSGSVFSASIKGCNVSISDLDLEKFELTSYPNPFSQITNISFYLSEANEVSLTVKNSMGQTVSALLNEKRMNPGEYEFPFSGQNLPSGIYFYTLKTKELSITKRMILQK